MCVLFITAFSIRGRPFDSEGGGGWQISSGPIIYFQQGLGRKINFQVYQRLNIYFLPQQKEETERERGVYESFWVKLAWNNLIFNSL